MVFAKSPVEFLSDVLIHSNFIVNIHTEWLEDFVLYIRGPWDKRYLHLCKWIW